MQYNAEPNTPAFFIHCLVRKQRGFSLVMRTIDKLFYGSEEYCSNSVEAIVVYYRLSEYYCMAIVYFSNTPVHSEELRNAATYETLPYMV